MFTKFIIHTFKKMRTFSERGERYFRYKMMKNRIEDTYKKLEFDNHDKKLYDKIINGEWEFNISCNYCGSVNYNNYLKSDSVEFYKHMFILKECEKCGLVYCDPRPNYEDILNFLKYSNWSKKIYVIQNNRPNILNVHRNIIQECLAYNHGAKSLFDVGSGGGTVLIEAQRMGLDVSGNDINRESSIYLSKNHGIEIFNEPTNRLSVKEKFDVITMLDYIEHTYTPFDDLQFASNHLNENGILYLKTLYLNCPNHKRMKDLWNLFGEGHFHYFRISTLLNIINDCNFRLLDVSLGDVIIKIIAIKKE